LDKLRDDISSDNLKNLTIDVSVIEDDPGSGKMVELLTVKCSTVTAPSKYDIITSNSINEYTVEVFANSENRAPRMVQTRTRDLEKKES
jgi:hypothetical protein